MATGLLNNTATNPYEGPTVQFEFDFFASGIDTANSRYLGGQINGSQKYGLGQWTYSTTTAQGAPGNTLQFAANGIPQAGFGQVVSATGIPAGTVVLSANNATGLVTLSAPTTAALAAGAAIVFGGSWPTTFAYGLYFNLGPSVRVGSFMLTNQYACAGVDLRGSFVPQANLLANAAAGATSLHVSDITCFVYANFFGDGAHTYAPPSPTNALRAIVQDANGSRQTVSVIGYAEDGPGLPGGTITLAAPGLATAITDATTSTVTVTPNTAAVWLKDGQYINFDTAANYQIGVDTLNGWLAFNGSCTFNSGLYIPPQGGAGRLYLNKSTATDNYIRYNPFDISTEFVQTANGSDTVLLRLADQGGPTGGWAVFGFGAQMANLPISPTGLPAGSLYRSGAGANAALMIV
jgi:hypothetical protein